MVNYKDSINSGLFNVSKGVKNLETGRWECKVSYNSEPFIFTTPKGILSNNKLVFKESFASWVDSVESALMEYISKNSVDIFNGKAFTEEKLRNSLRPSHTLTDNLFSLSVKISESVKCFNTFNEVIPFSELSEKVVCQIEIHTISFSKDSFEINYKVVGFKSSKVKLSVSFDEPTNPDSFFD